MTHDEALEQLMQVTESAMAKPHCATGYRGDGHEPCHQQREVWEAELLKRANNALAAVAQAAPELGWQLANSHATALRRLAEAREAIRLAVKVLERPEAFRSWDHTIQEWLALPAVQAEAMSDTCRGCQAPIRWVTTEAGKAMLVDLEVRTTTDPKIVLYGADGTRLAQQPGVERTGHVPHWASCVAREEFTRRRITRRAPNA